LLSPDDQVVRVNPERFNRLKAGTGKGLLDSLVAIVKSKDATPFLSEYYLYISLSPT